LCYQVGTGSSVNIWQDPWIPQLPNFTPPIPPSDHPLEFQQVADLIIHETKQWNYELLHNLFEPQTANLIQKIHIPSLPTEDRIIWVPNKNETFTTKSAYLVDQHSRISDSGPLQPTEWKKLWNLKVNERLKLMLWKIAWESLSTKEFIGNHIHLDDINCPHCNSQTESVVHLFFECPIAVIIWR
jgi:hypothetical protein